MGPSASFCESADVDRSPGNTDTKHYWNLTKHIFRYSQSSYDTFYNGAHTINEAIKPTAVVEKIGFHTKFILNWDEADI